jgi:hypothetical protein
LAERSPDAVSNCEQNQARPHQWQTDPPHAAAIPLELPLKFAHGQSTQVSLRHLARTLPDIAMDAALKNDCQFDGQTGSGGTVNRRIKGRFEIESRAGTGGFEPSDGTTWSPSSGAPATRFLVRRPIVS